MRSNRSWQGAAPESSAKSSNAIAAAPSSKRGWGTRSCASHQVRATRMPNKNRVPARVRQIWL